MRQGCNGGVALSVMPRRATSPKGRGKKIHRVCDNQGKNTRRCGGTLFAKEGKGLEIVTFMTNCSIPLAIIAKPTTSFLYITHKNSYKLVTVSANP